MLEDDVGCDRVDGVDMAQEERIIELGTCPEKGSEGENENSEASIDKESRGHGGGYPAEHRPYTVFPIRCSQASEESYSPPDSVPFVAHEP